MSAESVLHAYMCVIPHALVADDERLREHAEWNIAGLADMLGLKLATSVLQRGHPA